VNVELFEKAAENMERIADEQKALSQRLDGLDRAVTEVAQKAHGADGGSVRGKKNNPFKEIATHPGIADLIAHKRTGLIMTMDGGIDLLRKTTITTQDGDDSDFDPLNVQPTRWPELANDPRRPLTILDALPRLPVSTGRFEYISLIGYSNAADEVAEAQLKPEAGIPTELKVAQIATIAHYAPVTEQILADAPAMINAFRGLLTYGVASKAESLIVNGAGTIEGLNALGTVFASSEDYVADRIGAAIAELEVDGYRPTHIFMNPRDWQAVRGERSQVENMYVMGSAAMPIGPALWSLPVVTSAAVSQGTAYVLDSSHVRILDRQQVTVQMGYADDDFIKNKIRIRAEARLGLAVFSPGGVLIVDTSPSS
jgi:HK97 family phage major capsid protein